MFKKEFDSVKQLWPSSRLIGNYFDLWSVDQLLLSKRGENSSNMGLFWYRQYCLWICKHVGAR